MTWCTPHGPGYKLIWGPLGITSMYAMYLVSFSQMRPHVTFQGYLKVTHIKVGCISKTGHRRAIISCFYTLCVPEVYAMYMGSFSQMRPVILLCIL
jgi:hypothetical protein